MVQSAHTLGGGFRMVGPLTLANEFLNPSFEGQPLDISNAWLNVGQSILSGNTTNQKFGNQSGMITTTLGGPSVVGRHGISQIILGSPISGQSYIFSMWINVPNILPSSLKLALDYSFNGTITSTEITVLTTGGSTGGWIPVSRLTQIPYNVDQIQISVYVEINALNVNVPIWYVDGAMWTSDSTFTSPSKILVSDSFNRPDSTTLGTADTGQPWIPTMNQSTLFGIENGIACLESVPTSGTSGKIPHIVIIESSASDVDVTAYGTLPELAWRWTADGNSGFYCSSALYFRVDNGVQVQLGSLNPAITVGAFSTTQVTVIGSQHIISVNGNVIATFIDSHYQTATRHGIRFNGVIGLGANSVQVNNFSVATPRSTSNFVDGTSASYVWANGPYSQTLKSSVASALSFFPPPGDPVPVSS